MIEREEDFVLLTSWRTGDRSAGGRLIKRYSGLLLRFFRTKVGEDADDLVQHTFVACTERKDAIQNPASFRAYLLAIARGVLVEHFRRKTRHHKRFDALETSVADLEPTPSQHLAKNEERRLMGEALRQIPLELQVALELYYWEGMAGPELAAALDLPEGTVRTRLRRGRQLVRERLAELGAPEDEPLGGPPR
ncbi:MAG: sigma-70 family RNA polymerase sigma factor [Nannocystaceae bacterium]|nr:sigma-70 family RNA polymerase sigma factor [Nannocystaceae bacterium]